MERLESELRWIDSQRQRMLALLTEWVGSNTGSYNVAGLERFAENMRPVLLELSDDVREVELGDHVVVNDRGEPAQRPLGKAVTFRARNYDQRTGPRVLLGIHYDTVFAKGDPFQAATFLEDGKILRGPGACDAKGGLLVMLFALLSVERSGAQLKWEALLNPDEELGSPGSGTLWTEAARRSDVGLLFEPALPDGALVGARKGSANYALVVRGKSAHAGRDFLAGRNAIHALAGLISRLAAMQERIPGAQVNVGFISGGGAVNIVPDLALARFNVRVENAAQAAAVEAELQEIEKIAPDGIRVELHRGSNVGPKALTEATGKMLAELKACGTELGLNLQWRPTGGVCDGNRVAAEGVPTVDSLGVRGGAMHTREEFVVLESLTERAKLVALFLMRLTHSK